MEIISRKQKLYTYFMGASILFGCVFLLTSHFNYIMNVIEYKALSITNIVYAILRFECVLLPIVFIMKRNAYYPKILMEKFLLGIFAVASMAGVMWIFTYLNYHKFDELFNQEYMYLHQAMMDNYIAVNPLMWGTTTFAGVIFSLVLALIYFITTLLMHWQRKIVASCFSVMFLFRTVTPIIYVSIYGDVGHSGGLPVWISNNIFWVLSALCMTLGLWVAAGSDDMWTENIWGEENRLDEEDEDEDY